MYLQTIQISAGNSENVGSLPPAEVRDIGVTVTSGEALLNGVKSTFMSWVNPNPSIVITAITDCEIEVKEIIPEP